MATRPPPDLHDIFINRGSQTQSDVAYSNLLDDRDPTQAREARVVGRDINVPAPTVEADLPGFKQEADNNRNLDMLDNDPAMARFLVDPHNAAAVKDDLPSLSDISGILRMTDKPGDPRDFSNYMKTTRLGQRGRLLSSIGSGPATSSNYSFSNIQKGAISDTFPKGQALYKPDIPPPFSLTDLAKGLDATITSTAANTGRGAEEFLADAVGLGDQYRNTTYFKDISAVGQRETNIANKPNEEINSYIGKQAYSATQSMAIMGASILSGSPLMAMSLSQGAPQYATVRERGGSANEALFSSVGSGAAEGIFERYFGLGWMLGNFGKKATGKFLGGLLLREVPSEVATTAVQDFFDAMTTGGGGWEGYKQRLPQDLLDTAVSTALMVGAVGGIHKVAHTVAPERQAIDEIDQAQAGKGFLDALMTAAEKSKVRKEDPATLHDFIEQRTQDSPVRNVYVPVEAVAQYMQSDNYKGELDRYQDQIAQAQVTQGDIVIPISDAVAHLAGTDAWAALKDQVRVQPGGLSSKEAAAKHAEIIDKLEQRGKEIAAEAQQADEQNTAAAEVYTEVKNRLRVSGLSDKEADNVAQLYAARYEARAAQRGGTPMEQFQRSKIVFPGESTDGKQKGRQFAQGATVNIGLDVNDGSKLNAQQVASELSKAGVTIQRSAVQQSGTEPTFVAQLDRALTPEEAHQVSVALKQDAIAQHTGTEGALYGPAAEKWGPFNPNYFLTLEGRTLNQAATIGGYEGLAPFLTDEEKDRLREDSKRKIMAIAETLPDAEEMAAVAHAGRAKRGWYENSAQAILDVFGAADAPRFAALLAALSPQTSVQSNLYNALKTWTNWNEAGRPTDRREIVEVMGRSVEGGRGTASVLNAWINNAVTALTAENPAKIRLSGPKVDSFMGNLMGVVDEVTNDTWMANYAGLERISSGGIAKKNATYKAMSAVTRAAADILSKRTGEMWTPAEVQETVWSLAKTLYETRDQAGENRTMRELLEAGHVTHDDIANTPDFGVLFADGIYRTILEKGGYGEAAQSLGRNRRAVGVNGQESVAAQPAAGFSEDAYRQFLAQAAERLESVRNRRIAQSAERRGDTRQRELFQDVMPETGWAPERVSGLIDQFGEEDGSSSAVAVMMSPDEFLGMTASAAGRERIAERASALGELDPARLASSPPITLTVAMGGENDTRPPPMIRGHEGRHRMTLLKEAGIARVPVVVQLTDKDGKAFKTKAPIRVSNIVPNRSRSDQLANGDLTGEINGVPISFRYQDKLADMGERVLFQEPQAPFYSALERAVEANSTTRASAAQWKATLARAPGVKQEELEWSGLTDWLDMQKGPVDKEALLGVVRDGGISVDEVVLGETASLREQGIQRIMTDLPGTSRRDAEAIFDNDPAQQFEIDEAGRRPQFSTWSSDPSNPSYRELLITLPLGERGNPARAPATHWDQEAVVAHARFMNKTDADGKRVLFVEEVQSDWHQKGRDQGYEQPVDPEKIKVAQEAFDKAREAEEAVRLKDHAASTAAHVALRPLAKEAAIKMHADLNEKSDAEAKRRIAAASDEAEKMRISLDALDKQRDNGQDATNLTSWGILAAQSPGTLSGSSLARMWENIKTVRSELGLDFPDRVADLVAKAREIDDQFKVVRNERELKQRELQAATNPSGIPDAPFKSTWPALVMKRMIKWAVDHGYEKVAWTTGEEQANRYNLHQQVGDIIKPVDVPKTQFRPEGAEFYLVQTHAARILTEQGLAAGTSHGSMPPSGYTSLAMTREQVKQAFGQDLGTRLADALPGETFRQDALRVGGEGMKAFYDRNLVNITNDIIKKYGAKVGPVGVEKFAAERGHPDPVTQTNPGFEITDKMREAASSGFSLFQDKGDGPRGSTTLTDKNERIIHLFANANRSTMLHETGHIWLEELRDDATAKDATDQDKADWKKVTDWFAANGSPMPAKGGFIPTEAHEMWARGVERYLMEGKAPTIGLRSVFRTFRAWLVRIYGVVQNLHTPITPEIREVMDRLIATKDALDDAARHNETAPLFKTAEEAGMTDAEFADYQQRVGDARDEAYDALLYKTMESIRRQRTQETRDQRAAIRAEVGQMISRQPQFRLLHLLRTGKWLGEPERPRQDVKLNTGWLIDNFGEDILDKLPKGLPITKGDGESGDVIAEMVGLGSGTEVVHTLVGMRAAADALRARGETRSMRDVLVAEEVDRVMAEQHGDVLDDGSIEEEAIAAINSARQGEIIASEARQLAKRKAVLGTPTPYQFAREWARRTVAAGHVRDVASRSALQRYIRASNKAARAAEEAILKGDVDEAYRQKQAQLLNHALLAEAKAAADRVDKIVARMKKLAGRAGMKSVDPDYMSKVHMLLEDYDFRPRSQRSIEEQQGFQEWLERQRAMGFEVHIPPRLENNGTPYTRVSVQELDSLSDLVESLIALGRTKQKIKIAQAERSFSEFRDEVVARIRQLPDRKARKPRWWKSGKLVKNSPINEHPRWLAEGAAELLKVETIVEELDGGPTGPLHDAIVLGSTEAENRRFDLRAKVLLPLAKTYHDMNRKQRARMLERVTIPELKWNSLNEGDPRIGQTVTMTRSELLSVLMNMGNLSNLEKLSKGERWPVETLKAVMDREMTKADFDLAQQMWDQVGLLWSDIVATEREQAGVVPEAVVASPIETKFGTYAGGYWPVVYDPARWQLAEDLEGKQLDDMFGIKTGVATQKGHTITRTGAFGPIQLSLENVLFHHIEQVVTRIAYASYARDVLRIVRDRSIRGWIDTKLGPEYRKQVEKWLARQVHEGAVHAKAARWWDSVMRQARINTTIAAMGFRISTGIAQTLGLTASAQRIGAKWVGVGMKNLALDPRGMTAFVHARSPEMLHRTEAVNREVSEVARKMRGRHGVLTEAQHWAMWHIGMMDRYTVSLPTWLGAHAKGLSEGMTDAEASAYGDKAVRQSQGSGREKDLSAIQSPNSEAMRFFTMFYTPWNVMFNAQWQGVRGVKRGNIRPMIAVTWWWLIVSMLGDAMLSGDWPKDKKEPMDWLKWAGRNIFFGLFAGIPILRDAANYAESQMIGQYASDVGTTPLTRIADAIEKAIKTGKKVYEGDEVDRAIKQTGDLTSILLGAPLSQLGTSAQFAWDVHQGTVHPKTLSDWYFGITRDKKPAKDEEAAQ